jgi:hypothetical protein
MTCRRLVQWSRGALDVYLIAMHDSLLQELVNDLETLHLGYLFGAFEFSCTVEIDGIVRRCGEMGWVLLHTEGRSLGRKFNALLTSLWYGSALEVNQSLNYVI